MFHRRPGRHGQANGVGRLVIGAARASYPAGMPAPRNRRSPVWLAVGLLVIAPVGIAVSLAFAGGLQTAGSGKSTVAVLS